MTPLISESSGITIGLAITLIGFVIGTFYKYSRDRNDIEMRFNELTVKMDFLDRLSEEVETLKATSATTLNWMARMEVKIDRLLEDVKNISQR